jgi:hypothetical protein
VELILETVANVCVGFVRHARYLRHRAGIALRQETWTRDSA